MDIVPGARLADAGIAFAANDVSQVTVRFSDPYWLLVGLAVGIALVAIWHRHDLWQRTALTRFIAPHLRLKLTGSVSKVGRFLQRIQRFIVDAPCIRQRQARGGLRHLARDADAAG